MENTVFVFFSFPEHFLKRLRSINTGPSSASTHRRKPYQHGSREEETLTCFLHQNTLRLCIHLYPTPLRCYPLSSKYYESLRYSASSFAYSPPLSFVCAAPAASRNVFFSPHDPLLGRAGAPRPHQNPYFDSVIFCVCLYNKTFSGTIALLSLIEKNE